MASELKAFKKADKKVENIAKNMELGLDTEDSFL